MSAVIIDTGALVALLDRSDAHHAWAVQVFKTSRPPLLTCEAVLAEAWHLLGQAPPSRLALLRLLRADILRLTFAFAAESVAICGLLEKYADLPMDFADACLVRLAELHPASTIWTVDSDFRIYRQNGRDLIPLIFPQDKI